MRYRRKNREKIREYERKWGKTNFRRQRIAMPPWANRFFIEEIYDLAERRTAVIGIAHEVDHVIPIRHPLVCGLHVETNLRVVPRIVNRKKGNQFIVE